MMISRCSLLHLLLPAFFVIPIQAGSFNVTDCYNYQLTTDPHCQATEMLLPKRFTLGISTIEYCHNNIQQATLKGVANISKCCVQDPNGILKDFCLPAVANSVPFKIYADFLETCVGSTQCALRKVQHNEGEDYATLEYECVNNSSVLYMKDEVTVTGREVYLYNGHKDGDAVVHCVAFTSPCQTINIEVVANRVLSPSCNINFNDGRNSSRWNCKTKPLQATCSPIFQSTSNYVNMSISMSVDPGLYSEYLWIKATASARNNVTVACGNKIPSSAFLECPTTSLSTSKMTTMETTISSTLNRTQPATTMANTFPKMFSTLTSHRASVVTSVPRTTFPSTKEATAIGSSSGKTDPKGNNDFLVEVIGISAGCVVVVLLLTTTIICVARRRKLRKKPDTTTQRSGKSERKRFGSVSSASSNEVEYMENPIYATDDFKMGELWSKRMSNTEQDPEGNRISTKTEGRPVEKGMKLRRNFWVTEDAPAFMAEMVPSYIDDVLKDETSSDDSRENDDALFERLRREEELSNLYAKVDKTRKYNQ